MAQFTVNSQRFDPYKNFKFRVKWDGRYVAGVSKVGALKKTTEVVEHRNGGDPSTSRKSPGRTKYEPITLERGVTHDIEFEAWANKVWNFGSGLGAEVSLKDFRKDLIIELYNEAGQLVHRLQGVPGVGLGVPGPARPRRQRQRGRHPDPQARARGLGARLRRRRAAASPSSPSRRPGRRSRWAPLSGGDLLDLWERAERPEPPRRALVLAAAGRDGGPRSNRRSGGGGAGRRPVDARCSSCGVRSGRTDAGRPSRGCPACDEEAEFAIDADAAPGLGRARRRARPTEIGGRRRDVAGAHRVATSTPSPPLEPIRRRGRALAPMRADARPSTVAVDEARPTELGRPPRRAVRAVVAAAMADADPLAEVLARRRLPGMRPVVHRPRSTSPTFAWREVRAGRAAAAAGDRRAGPRLRLDRDRRSSLSDVAAGRLPGDWCWRDRDERPVSRLAAERSAGARPAGPAWPLARSSRRPDRGPADPVRTRSAAGAARPARTAAGARGRSDAVTTARRAATETERRRPDDGPAGRDRPARTVGPRPARRPRSRPDRGGSSTVGPHARPAQRRPPPVECRDRRRREAAGRRAGGRCGGPVPTRRSPGHARPSTPIVQARPLAGRRKRGRRDGRARPRPGAPAPRRRGDRSTSAASTSGPTSRRPGAAPAGGTNGAAEGLASSDYLAGKRAAPMSSPLAIGAVSAVLRNLLDNGMVDVGAPIGAREGLRGRSRHDQARRRPGRAAAQPLPVPGHAEPRVAQRRPAELRRQRLAPHQPAARPRPPLPAHRLRHDGLPGRDPPRLRDAPPPRAAGPRPGRHPHRARPQPARPVDPAAGVPGAGRRRPRRPARGGDVTPEPMDTEEMSRLWSAIQAHYRPDGRLRRVGRPDRVAAARSHRPAGADPRPARPRHGSRARRGGEPASCRPTRRSSGSSRPTTEPAVALGDTVRLAGHHLDGTDDHGLVRASPARRLRTSSTSLPTTTTRDRLRRWPIPANGGQTGSGRLACTR